MKDKDIKGSSFLQILDNIYIQVLFIYGESVFLVAFGNYTLS